MGRYEVEKRGKFRPLAVAAEPMNALLEARILWLV